MLPKTNDQRKKKTICQIFHQKRIQKVLMKIEEMAGVFLNLANFVHMHFWLSGYTLNLKALINFFCISDTFLCKNMKKKSRCISLRHVVPSVRTLKTIIFKSIISPSLYQTIPLWLYFYKTRTPGLSFDIGLKAFFFFFLKQKLSWSFGY